ncbi:MAG: amidohydrolase [Planctomyces sp.]|nr:amidohydrolase [Planctomyces sp.]
MSLPQPSASSLSRREFLGRASAALAVATVAGGTARAQSDVEAGFVDAHSHIWTTDLERYPLAGGQPVSVLAPRSFTAEELLAIVRPLGVSRVVLIQHKPYHGLDNRCLADAMAEHPGVFGGVACIEAGAPRPDVEMLRLKTLGFRGFRITPGEGGTSRWSASEGMRLMWGTAAAQGLAICPLIDAAYLEQVDEMCRRFPETRVVIDHFARIGGTGEFPEADLAALTGLAKHPRVHVKVSAYYYLGRKRPPYDDLAPMIRRMYDAYGPQRLMWGSDSPYQLGGENTYAASLKLIQEGLDFLSAEDRDWLLRKSATGVFFSG